MRSIKIYIKLNIKIYMFEYSILTNEQKHENIIYWKMYDAYCFECHWANRCGKLIPYLHHYQCFVN